MSNMNLYQKITCYILGMTVIILGIIPINPAFTQENVNNEPDQPPVQNNCPLNEDTPYTLGPGDRIRIDLFNVPEYSGEFIVLVDGTLNLPLLDDPLPVLGLKLSEVKKILTKEYTRFLKRPIVTVGLTGTRPLKIAISGEVSRPGAYIIGQNGGAFPSLTQVVQLAGGITSGADIRQVLLRRRELNCTAQVNIWNLIQNANIAEDITLRDGDAIFIPSTNIVNPQEVRQLGSANIAASGQSVKVAIVGEVNRPGPYTLGSEGGGGSSPGAAVNSKSPTVTKAIQQAGGISGLADIRKISIQRTTKTAGIQTIEVNLWQLLQTGDQNQDIFLQDGDTITIPKATNLTPEETSQLANANFSPDKITVNVVGEVNRAGAITIPPNTPLNQALLAAGGFNTRAHSGTVDLIRLNPNGTVTKRVISVNFAQGVNDKTNPIIHNNDFIIVRKSGAASVGDTLGTILNPLGNFFSLFNFFRIFQ